MRNYLIIISCLLSQVVNAQSFTLGGDAKLFLGSEGKFFFGGNTQLNGGINNQGTFVSFSDMNFGANTDGGNIKFTGTADQTLTGEEVSFGDFTVDKEGQLRLNGNRMFISGMFNATRGSFNVRRDQQLVFSGSTFADGDGFVVGRVLGRASGAPLIFPMGINGFRNYLTLEGVAQGNIVSVEIEEPDQATLLPDKDIVGIAHQMEWVVTPEADGVEAIISVDFSGIDLQNFTNGQEIRSEKYEPALVLFSREDTLFHTVPGFFIDGSEPQASSFGIYQSAQPIRISQEGERLAMALVPIIIRPHFFVPNSFAPNGTLDENRIFRPFFSGEKLTSVYMRVFDSFNKEVYIFDQSGDNVDLSLMGWDGTLPTGLEAPNGTYYYTIKMQGESDSYTRSGAVLLMK